MNICLFFSLITGNLQEKVSSGQALTTEWENTRKEVGRKSWLEIKSETLAVIHHGIVQVAKEVRGLVKQQNLQNELG